MAICPLKVASMLVYFTIILCVMFGITHWHRNLNVDFSLVSYTSVPPPVLRVDGHIRNCITNAVIAKAPNYTDTQTVALQSSHNSADDTSTIQRKAFKKIFDNREWGTQKDDHYGGPVASGNKTKTTFTMCNQFYTLMKCSTALISGHMEPFSTNAQHLVGITENCS